MSQGVLAVCLFFHILATVVWLGGIFLIAFLVMPQVKAVLGGRAELRRIMLGIRGRFALVGNMALVTLVVTGLLQMAADPNYDGLLRMGNAWSRALLLKHALIVVMAGLGLWLQHVVAPALERAGLLLQRGKGGEEWERLERIERRLTLCVAGLALLILGVSAWLVSI